MRISYLASKYLASAALAVCIVPLATPAYAGGSSSQGITYGSGSYGSTNHSSHSPGMHGSHSSGSHSSHSMSTRYGSASTSPCPSGSSRANDGYCISSGSSSSVGISGASTHAATGGYTSPPSMAPSMGSTQMAMGEYTSPPSMAPSMGGANTISFTSSARNISHHRIDGMGSNEFLSATTCPTSVYNPGGAKVLGCYSVVKKAPVPVYRPAPVVVPQTHYQQVRVVRPIIYVRYPVPTPVPVYQQNFSHYSHSSQYQSGGCGVAYSRYGNNWPRMGGCGGW